MPQWMKFAFISMFFAGFTSVIAKHGMRDVSGELAIFIRTVFVFIFISAISLITLSGGEFSEVRACNLFWFGLSGLTTSLSWYFYYRALKHGDVATVALIDKSSILIAMLLGMATFARADHATYARRSWFDYFRADCHFKEVIILHFK